MMPLSLLQAAMSLHTTAGSTAGHPCTTLHHLNGHECLGACHGYGLAALKIVAILMAWVFAGHAGSV